MADPSRRIHVGDIELSYRICGRGPPVILVHGLACGQRMWFHQRRKLSDRHTVITYDQRGHGHSDAPDDASRYSAGHLTRDLAGMVDALNLDKVAIVGFSMGGGPALALAAARPDRITHPMVPFKLCQFHGHFFERVSPKRSFVSPRIKMAA